MSATDKDTESAAAGADLLAAAAKMNVGKSMWLSGFGDVIKDIRAMAQIDAQEGVQDEEMSKQLEKIEQVWAQAQQLPDYTVEELRPPGAEAEAEATSVRQVSDTEGKSHSHSSSTPGGVKPVFKTTGFCFFSCEHVKQLPDDANADTLRAWLGEKKHAFVMYGNDNAASKEARSMFDALAKKHGAKSHVKFIYIDVVKHPNGKSLMAVDKPTVFPSVYFHTQGSATADSSSGTLAHMKTFIANRAVRIA